MKLSVGIKIDGFNERKITDNDIIECRASKVLLYIDKESNDRLMDYYKAVRSILRKGDNQLVVVINEDDNSNIVQPLIHLCLEYGCYNIYKVLQDIVIDKEYVLDLFSRESNADEVKLYISTEGEAFETINEAILEITEMCLDNKLSELQDYIIHNKDLVKAYPSVLSYMKQNIDEANLGIGIKVRELERKLNTLMEDKKEVDVIREKLQDNILNLENVVSQQEEENKKISYKLTSYESAVDKLKKDNEDLEEENKRLQNSAQASNGGVFLNYSSIKITQLKGNRLKTIIYVKEISRPKYINTMMLQLFNYLNDKFQHTKGKIKMAIYDSKEDFGVLYNPLLQVNTQNYFMQKNEVLDSKIVVYTDTNPTYLEDIARHSKAEYLIIYDRLGQNTDLLVGDAVIKFYAFASKKDLINYKSKFADLDESRVIMNPAGVSNTLELSEIDGFSSSSSQSAQFAKYYRLAANKNSASKLFDSILAKCGLQGK